MKRISQASEVRQVEGPGSLRFTKVSQDKIRYSRDRGGKEPEKCELDLMMDAAHPDYYRALDDFLEWACEADDLGKSWRDEGEVTGVSATWRYSDLSEKWTPSITVFLKRHNRSSDLQFARRHTVGPVNMGLEEAAELFPALNKLHDEAWYFVIGRKAAQLGLDLGVVPESGISETKATNPKSRKQKPKPEVDCDG